MLASICNPSSAICYFPTLAVYVHDLSPFLVGPIRWYGLSYIAGFIAAWLMIRRVCTVGVTTLQPQHASDLVFSVAIGVIIGGRLGFVLFYDLPLLWTVFDDPPWWGLLAINHGGMASHGGIIGAAVGGWLYARKHQQPLRFIWDLMALATPLGLCFGRIANFINGELWGRRVDESFPLAVKFPQELYEWPADAPQLDQVEQIIAVETGRATPDAITTAIDLIRAGNETVTNAIASLLPARHPSQLYQAALEGLLLFLILLVYYRKSRRPGSVGALFLLGYAVMRIIGEQFREPDEGIGYQLFGLTRGQWLSVAVLAGGVFLTIYVSKKRESPMGGWLKAGGPQPDKA